MPIAVTAAGLAELSGVDVDAIQDFERRGLLPGPRLQSGRRSPTPYRQEHLDRLHFIQRCLGLGFSLEAIADLLGVKGGMLTCGDIYTIAAHELETIRARIAALQRTEQELSALVQTCPRTGPAAGCPIWHALQAPPARK